MAAPWRTRFLFVAVCFCTIACAASAKPRRADNTMFGSTALQITNAGSDDLQLFLVRSGTNVSIGAVPAQSTRVFWLTSAQLGAGGDLQLLAQPRSAHYVQRSAVFVASDGQRIAWIVGQRIPSEVVTVK